MAEVLLFHHAHGLTPGVRGFADRLRAAGHIVHTPDLYDGQVFDTLEDGMAYAEATGFGELLERGRRAAASLPARVVYAGFSLGVVPAQALAQTRPGAAGALLLHACLPVEEFGTWPAGVPVEIHAAGGDPFFAEDADAAKALLAANPDAELVLYAGDAHLFADPGLPSYDDDAAAELVRRVLQFLERVTGAATGGSRTEEGTGPVVR